MPPRKPISQLARHELSVRQDGHCALCARKHPLEAHHIMPHSFGGDDHADNLVLLCRNHHEIADSGILPSEMLRLYRDNPGLPVELPDEAILYAMRSDEIRRTLDLQFDYFTIRLGLKLIGRLGRAHDARYRRVYLELVDSVVGAMVRHRPREFKKVALSLIRRVVSFRLDIAGQDESYLIARIIHHQGLLLSQLGNYSAAIESYDEATQQLGGGEDMADGRMGGELAQIRVHRSAAMHLGGDTDEARDMAREVDDQAPATQAATYARIKLAEHCIVRSDISGAAGLLGPLVEGFIEGYQRPIAVNHTIALKDWAVVQVHGGDRTSAVRAASAGLAIAKELGFRDQEEKVVMRLGEVGIGHGELRLC